MKGGCLAALQWLSKRDELCSSVKGVMIVLRTRDVLSHVINQLCLRCVREGG